MNHIQKCGQQEITSVKLSKESHLYWKDHFHMNPIFFKIIVDFEAPNELDNSNIGNETTNVFIYISKMLYLMVTI